MTWPDDFAAITKLDEPLAPYTHLKIGGPAERFVQPVTADQLGAVLRHCADARLPVRVLGGGVNLLVRDEPLPGVVLRLSTPAFTGIRVEGTHVRAGCGTALPTLISATARAGLAGFETLVGIPGTVGGALRHNAGGRDGEIGQFVRRVEVMDERGNAASRERDELVFAENSSNLDDMVLVAAEFDLDPDDADAIVKRMRKAWITRKAGQPFSFEAAARLFQNPKGFQAHALLEQAGLAGTRVGGAEVSGRNANYVIAHPGTTARDVLRLMELMKSKVREHTGVVLEPEIVVW